MTPIVSIVIPTYNRDLELKRALQSIISQSYSDWEVLVVDNNSHDNTDEIVNSFKDIRIKLFKVHNNGVIAVSRNVGIKHSSGKYIAFLDSDDWWMPQKLEYSLKQLELGADLVYHDMFLATKNEQKYFLKKTKARHLSNNVFADLIMNGNPIVNSSVVVRKELLQQIGGLTEDVELIAMEDYDTWLRVAQNTTKFKKIPKILGYYWLGGGNTSSADKMLTTISTFEKKYKNYLSNLESINYPWWINYSRGRAYYLLGDYINAALTWKNINLLKTPLLIILRMCYMKIIMEFFIFQKKVI